MPVSTAGLRTWPGTGYVIARVNYRGCLRICDRMFVFLLWTFRVNVVNPYEIPLRARAAMNDAVVVLT